VTRPPALVHPRPVRPAGDGPRPLRLAYLVSSYRSQGQVSRLLTTLRRNDPDAEIVLLHNGFHSPLDPGVVAAVGGHLHLSSVPVVWGDMTLEAERLRVLRWMVAELDFDWVVTLSEQDYPLAPAEALRDRLAAGRHDAVLDTHPLDEVVDPATARDLSNRYGFRYHSLPRWLGTAGRVPGPLTTVLGRLVGLSATLLERTQPLLRLYLLDSGAGSTPKLGRRASLPQERYRTWWASAWFALSREATRSLCAQLEAEPELRRHFERTIIPTEGLIATALANNPSVSVESAALHEIRWSDPTSGRPDEFGDADIDHLLTSGRFFARKFPEGSAVLDRLDEVTRLPGHAVPDPSTAELVPHG
jgi:hypothetical protein